ncbi:transmembrane protein 45A [Grus japonensis]|uniref:Transmembrane protein 45A n=1 Tax=Grus japonensis TaxID=30415 RepID=A0ABC9VXB0_GRUJA
MVAEQFVPDGPHLKLYNYEEKHWDHLMNWQHATMYLFYGISGLVDIVAHGTNALPVAMDRMMLSLAVFIEVAYLRFSNWLRQKQKSYENSGTSLFWIGFVLYPPNGSPEWNQTDHMNMMFLTMCYCWHYAFAFLILAVNYTIVTWAVRSKVKQSQSMEMGLLKTSERDQESEDEI